MHIGAFLLLTLMLQSGPTLKSGGQQPSVPAGQVGTENKVVYRDDVYKFEYEYESSLVNSPDIAKHINDDARQMKGGIDCLDTPLSALDTTHGMRMLMIMHLGGKCLGTPVGESQLGFLAQASLQKGLQAMGGAKLGPFADYSVSGHKASTDYGSATSEKLGVTVFAQSTCVLVGQDAMCWMLLAGDCAQIAPLASGTIHFADEAKEPLIPARLELPCSSADAKTPAH